MGSGRTPVGEDSGVPRRTTRFGEVEILADLNRPGGHLLLIDRIRQSYVDLDDPTYLEFEYAQCFADVLDALPAGPLAVTHVGGGAATMARYVAATRPGSSQIVFEPDAELTALIRQVLPFRRDARIRIRAEDGRPGLRALGDASADVVVLDAFTGGRVPAQVTSTEFFADVARVLRPGGVLLVNVADGPPGLFLRRLLAAIAQSLPHRLALADPAVLKLRRYGNVVLAASAQPLAEDAIATAAARAMFPRRVLAGARLQAFVGSAAPLTDADPMRSPQPPEEIWRVG